MKIVGCHGLVWPATILVEVITHSKFAPKILPKPVNIWGKMVQVDIRASNGHKPFTR